MKEIIDRFEGLYAVCGKANREMINIDIYKIPPEAKEGDVPKIANSEISIDLAEAKKEIDDLTQNLWI